jgi:hypothetical protein
MALDVRRPLLIYHSKEEEKLGRTSHEEIKIASDLWRPE